VRCTVKSHHTGLHLCPTISNPVPNPNEELLPVMYITGPPLACSRCCSRATMGIGDCKHHFVMDAADQHAACGCYSKFYGSLSPHLCTHSESFCMLKVMQVNASVTIIHPRLVMLHIWVASTEQNNRLFDGVCLRCVRYPCGVGDTAHFCPAVMCTIPDVVSCSSLHLTESEQGVYQNGRPAPWSSACLKACFPEVRMLDG